MFTAPPTLMACLLTNDGKLMHGALAYWEMDAGGGWAYKVQAIADYWEMSPRDTSAKIREIAPAYVLSQRCRECSLPMKAVTRSDVDRARGKRPSICEDCLQREMNVRLSAERVAYEHRLNSERAALQAQTEIWERETSNVRAIEYWSLDFVDVIRSFALLNTSQLNERSEIKAVTVPPLTPTPGSDKICLKRLHNCDILQFGRASPVSAFLVGEKSGEFRYYPDKVTWRFAPVSDEPSEALDQTLSELIDYSWSPLELWQAVDELWWEIGRTEIMRYLDAELGKYDLRSNDGPALAGAINHALKHYSIPQVRNLIWMVAKDAAAYSARVDVGRSRAINSIPGSLVRKVDRSIVDSWNLKPFILKWEEEECALITTLFDRVLRSGRLGFGTLSGKIITERLENAQTN